MTGSHAATTWLKDQMLLRKPMYACMPRHRNIKHAHSNALRHFMHTMCPYDMHHIMPTLQLSSRFESIPTIQSNIAAKRCAGHNQAKHESSS